uniref:Cation channel sperm-associated protein 1 n=3 Tax=Pecora TaxID=35500 RepID=A0A8C6D770_MOSMO
MSAKAQNEADTDDSDVFSHPGSSTPYHRPSHGGVHHHHQGASRHRGEPQHRGLSHHHGGLHNPDEFHDFHENVFSRHAHRSYHTPSRGESHHHGGNHHSTSLSQDPSHDTLISHQSYGEDHFDNEHHHGSRRHHGRSRQHREPNHHGGFHHHTEVPDYSGLHRQNEAYHHKDSTQSSSRSHLSEAYHHGGHHHRRPTSMMSYQHGPPHHGKHHRGDHHHREHQRGARPHDYPHRDHHHAEYRHRSPQLFGSYTSHTVPLGAISSAYSGPAVFQPNKPDRKSSAFNLVRSLSTVNSHPSETSNKGAQMPRSLVPKSLPFWPFTVARASRIHKKVHSSDFLYWLWEKLSQLIWGVQRMLRKLVDSLAFETFIIFIVCLNTIMLVAQTFAEVEVRGEWYFTALDYIFLSIYVVEAVLKITALGFVEPLNYFFIVIMGLLDFVLIQVNSSSTRAIHNQSVFRIFRVFKTLRALRAIRVLRRLRFLTNLQEVTGTLARSLPSITAILILMFTCLFLFSVVLRALFRHSDPKRFQNIFTTIFTLFTMLTLDDWSLIYLDSRAQGAWYIIPILMIYIIIQYFIFLNLVIAVLVDNFQMALLKGLEKVKQEKAAELHEDLLDDSVTKLMKAGTSTPLLPGQTESKQLIEKKFGAMTEKQLETLFHFLQLVAGVEHYQLKFRSQAAVIDEIVDTTFEVNQAGPGRSQMERAGHWKARLRALVPGSGLSESSVGLPEAEAGAITSHPLPGRLEKRTSGSDPQRGSLGPDFSLWLAIHRLWPSPHILWKDRWACRGWRGSGQQSFKTPGGSVSSLAQPKYKGTCVHACMCILSMYTWECSG